MENLQDEQWPLLSVVVPARDPHLFQKSFFKRWLELDSLLVGSDIIVEIIFIHTGGGVPLDIALADFRRTHIHYHFSDVLWGPSRSRNYGIAEATGKYVFFHDVDDLIVPEKLYDFLLSLQDDKRNESVDIFIFKYLKSRSGRDTVINHGIIYEGRDLCKEDLADYAKKYAREPHTYTLLVHVWTKIFKLDFLQRNKLFFNVLLDQLEDVNFNFKALSSNPAIRLVNLSFYRYHVSSGPQNLSALSGNEGRNSVTGIYRALSPVKVFLHRVVFVGSSDSRSYIRHLYSTITILWLIRALNGVCDFDFKRVFDLVKVYASDVRVRRAMKSYKSYPKTSRLLPLLLRFNLPRLASCLLYWFPPLRKGF